MRGGIADIHRQLAAAAVEVERAGLEGRALAPVEVGEIDEIVQQLEQVALVADQLFQLHRMLVVQLFLFIVRNQLLQPGLGAAVEQRARLGRRHVAQRRSGIGAEPGLAGCELGLQRLPLRGVERLHVGTQQRHHHLAVEGLHGLAPGRVVALHQRQRAARDDGRQRQRGNRVTAAAQQVLAQRGIAFGAGAQRHQRRGVKRRQARAREEILDLALHGIERLGRGHGCVALRQHTGVVQRLLVPGLNGAHIDKEGIERGARHARFAIDPFAAAVELHDAAHQVAEHRCIGQRLGVDQAIAIERHGIQRSQALLHFGQRESILAFAPGPAQDALGLGMQRRAGLGVGAQAGELQRIAAAGQHLGIADLGRGPFAGLHQFRRADAAVLVMVDQIQRRAVEFNAPRGAGQRHPQGLVQFADMGDIFAGTDGHLVHPAGTEKLPCVLLHPISNSWATPVAFTGRFRPPPRPLARGPEAASVKVLRKSMQKQEIGA